jgi:flagellar basal-body rod modification protein FlgD
MATAATGIWNHSSAPSQALAGATPMDTPSSSSSSSDSATISANDFLTLLVTEMQNQDPTATTDPNEYINQLVNVNSLEQLISINQTLTTGLGSSTPTTGATGTGTSAQSVSAKGTNAASQVGAAAQVAGTSTAQSAASQNTLHSAEARNAPGNLGIPKANAAAQRVAQALNGQQPAR